MMKLNIQLFGGRGAKSSNENKKEKKGTFTIATYNMSKGGKDNTKVNGVVYKYKGIDVGVYGKKQNSQAEIRTLGRGEDNYVAVVITNNEANGAMIESGKTKKEAIEKANKLIDKRKKDILRAIGRKK